MRCPHCGAEAVLILAQNADIHIRIDPETMTVTGADLIEFDHTDIELGCCGSVDIPEKLYKAAREVTYTIGEDIEVTQTGGQSA